MNADEVEAYLQSRGLKAARKDIPYGQQLRLPTKEIVNVYDSGSIVFMGKKTRLRDEIEAWINAGGVSTSAASGEAARVGPALSATAHKVFVVYGHDTGARDGLELILRRLGLNPIVLQHVPAAGDTIIEKLDRYIGTGASVAYACVLLTPDDEGHKAGQPGLRSYRARQNVILELGMVLAKLGRKRVAILTKESVERPSDIAGLIYIPFKERVDEVPARQRSTGPTASGLRRTRAARRCSR